MEDPTNFEELVQWAYSTLPQKVRRLPDFPGIQVVDEPPPDVLKEMVERGTISPRGELLGLYSGTLRTKRSFFQLKHAPDLIFIFRGPILRCSKGDLRSEVKRVVWHEVAHWLGFETEEQVEALGL
jgi:predicted Zn-dependent protease with MMP-like domain